MNFEKLNKAVTENENTVVNVRLSVKEVLVICRALKSFSGRMIADEFLTKVNSKEMAFPPSDKSG